MVIFSGLVLFPIKLIDLFSIDILEKGKNLLLPRITKNDIVFHTVTNLEKLEIWSNPIKYVSPEIQKLTKLKSMRMEKDNLTKEQMEEIRKWLPNTEINFQ